MRADRSAVRRVRAQGILGQDALVVEDAVAALARLQRLAALHPDEDLRGHAHVAPLADAIARGHDSDALPLLQELLVALQHVWRELAGDGGALVAFLLHGRFLL